MQPPLRLSCAAVALHIRQMHRQVSSQEPTFTFTGHMPPQPDVQPPTISSRTVKSPFCNAMLTIAPTSQFPTVGKSFFERSPALPRCPAGDDQVKCPIGRTCGRPSCRQRQPYFLVLDCESTQNLQIAVPSNPSLAWARAHIKPCPQSHSLITTLTTTLTPLRKFLLPISPPRVCFTGFVCSVPENSHRIHRHGSHDRRSSGQMLQHAGS